MPLNEHSLPPASGKKPKQVVIFLHGLGDSGQGGLLSIGQIWQRDLPDCEFLCPDAPFAYDMAPVDFGGRQWFGLQNFTPSSITEGVVKAAPMLNAYMDRVLAARNLTADRLALVGFSQGTMMALYVAPRRADPVACVVGYSGVLVGGQGLVTEKKSTPPILLVHGTRDEVVPYASLARAENELQAAGIPVSSMTCPGLGHSIDDAGMDAGLAFIKKGFGV